MGRWIVVLVMGMMTWQVFAQEHPACKDLAFVDIYDSTAELLLIANSCQAPAVSELYLNRAHHRKMLMKFELFERSLVHIGDGDNRAYIESYRIHIGLAEAFAAARLALQDEEVVRRLNRVYDESTEIAEMRFRGYDLIANRLERQYQL
jgi:hypothetical protein